jgi:hypothetical protein
MSCIWANARTRWPSTRDATHLTPGKADPTGLHTQHRRSGPGEPAHRIPYRQQRIRVHVRRQAESGFHLLLEASSGRTEPTARSPESGPPRLCRIGGHRSGSLACRSTTVHHQIGAVVSSTAAPSRPRSDRWFCYTLRSAASCSEDLGPPMLETPLRPPALCWLPCYGSDRETGSNLRDKASEQAAGQPAAKPRDGPGHRRR